MSNGKISDLFFEVGYKINPTGMKKMGKVVDEIGGMAYRTGIKINGVGDSLDDITIKSKGLGNEFISLQSSLNGIVGAGLSLVSVGVGISLIKEKSIEAVNSLSDFDDGLRTVVSKLGVNEEQLRELSPIAKQVARDYHVMAKSVTEAQNYLALAGYPIEDIKKGTEIVVAAQKATGESMKRVSDIATDVASAYGYGAERLEYFTDKMLYTTSTSNTGFIQIGEAMKYVAPIAKQAGMNFGDLNAYIGTLANNLIKGSRAGTSLRRTFLKLQAPTKEAQRLFNHYGIALYNKKREFLGINKVMLNIEKAMKKMTDKEKAMFKQTVFGTEAMTAINILFDKGIKNVMEYGEAISVATGKTKEMATFMEQGLGGVRRSVEAEKEALSLVLGEALEPAAISFLTHIKTGLEYIKLDTENNKETKSNLALGFSEIFGHASRLGMAVINEIPGTINFLFGGAISAYGKKIKEKNNRSLNLYPDFKNISFQKLDLYPYDLPGMNYYKKPISEEIIEETVEEKVKKIVLEIKVNGTDTLGKDVANVISDQIQKSFEEAMKYELSTTSINFGTGFSYK